MFKEILFFKSTVFLDDKGFKALSALLEKQCTNVYH